LPHWTLPIIRKRLRELLHEVQREEAGDERMTAVKMGSRSSEALQRMGTQFGSFAPRFVQEDAAVVTHF
jgi:hypothetical protein